MYEHLIDGFCFADACHTLACALLLLNKDLNVAVSCTIRVILELLSNVTRHFDFDLGPNENDLSAIHRESIDA